MNRVTSIFDLRLSSLPYLIIYSKLPIEKNPVSSRKSPRGLSIFENSVIYCKTPIVHGQVMTGWQCKNGEKY